MLRMFHRVAAVACLLIAGLWLYSIPTEARFPRGSAAAPLTGASKRSVINSNGLDQFNFAFIDAFKQQDAFGPTGGGSWFGPTDPVWNSGILDANGYPNHTADGRFWGGGIRIASSSNYSGQYIYDGSGDGRINFPSSNGATYTVNGGASNNVTVNGNGDWTLTGGAGSFKVVFTYTGPQQLLSYYVSSTDPSNNGHYLKDMRFYRNDGVDNVDIGNGLVFRRPFKQSIADLDPALFRTLDWTATNGSLAYRWGDRPLPGSGAGYVSYRNYWNAAPAYLSTTGSSNAWVCQTTCLNSVTPSTNMVHGEIAAVRVTNGMVRGGPVAIGDISKANPGVATAYAHGYNNGDIIIITGLSAGMTQLNFVPLTVTVVDADHFSIGVNTTGFGTYTTQVLSVSGSNGSNQLNYPSTGTPPPAGSYISGPNLSGHDCTVDASASTFLFMKGCTLTSNVTTQSFYFNNTPASIYTTLQVGSGGNRTAYPIMWPDAIHTVSIFGNGQIPAGSYQYFYFDKTIAGQANTSGTFTKGAWVCRCAGLVSNPEAGVPLEIITKFYNEVKALNPRRPVNWYLNVPHVGLQSMDPDYSAPQNWPINAITLIKANLDASLNVTIENSNETWNGTFTQAAYLAMNGFYRWGPTEGFTDFGSFASIRSINMVQDLQGAFPADPRLTYTMGMFSTFGSTGVNDIRINGSTFTKTDVLNPSALGTMAFHNFLSQAAYVYADDGTAGLSAKAASWVSNIGNPVAQEAVCASYVNFIIGSPSTQETIQYYGVNILGQFTAALNSYPGTQVIGYEGGWDHDVVIAGNGFMTLTSGSPTVTYTGGISGTLGGQYIVADGVSDGVNTFVTATGSGGTATLSANATATRTVAYEAYDTNPMFLRACKMSTAWANAWVGYLNYFNSNPQAAMPADFIDVNNRWGHIWPSSYGYAFTSPTEYTTQDGAWTGAATRNGLFN